MERSTSSTAIRRNVEIKAHCPDPQQVASRLRKANARYIGLDEQRDTYFKVEEGRLKLREGTIENALIYYRRTDESGPKLSDVRIYRNSELADLREVLLAGLAVDVVVDKSRHIYFLDNVKIHLDTVPVLGHFVEVEAIDPAGTGNLEQLRRQCQQVMEVLNVRPGQLVSTSYSDLLRSRRDAPRWEF